MTSEETGEAFFTVRNLVLSRGSRQVLSGISLAVAKGEVFGLLGPNGAGKSSAFQALAGLLPAESGEVVLDGVTMPMGDSRLRSRMGVVFQSPALDDRLTARQNLALAATLYGLGGSERTDRVSRMIELADLEGRDCEPVKKLSGGMRRRLELSRALIHEPAMLLMDEPTTGLDEPSYQRFWKTVKELAVSRGVAVLLTTHRAEEAELCDRLAFLNDGKIIACDRPEVLTAQVGGDILELAVADTEAAAREIAEKLGLGAEAQAGRVVIVAERGHELVPRVVEALPVGSLSSISVHRPGIGDVFLKLAGRGLGEEEAA